MDITLFIDAIGAGGTILSVLWAIKAYKNENENANILKVKNAILGIPSVCNELNALLSEPFFAALGNSIADELKNLMEEKQSIEEFSEFLLDDEKSHNYKAQAIYSGLKKCNEVSEIKTIINKLNDLNRQISITFPGIGRALGKLLFYICRAANQTISSHVICRSMSAVLDDDIENMLFKKSVENCAATGSKELYFKEFAVFITSVATTSLRRGALGQRTIDLSLVMIENTCKTLGNLEIAKLKRLRRKDAKIIKKIAGKSEKHAVEDAMAILKGYKKHYEENSWEKMIECKGRIIENMENDIEV